MQKIVLVMVPVLLALAVPLYAWSREGVSFVLFGCALGVWVVPSPGIGGGDVDEDRETS